MQHMTPLHWEMTSKLFGKPSHCGSCSSAESIAGVQNSPPFGRRPLP